MGCYLDCETEKSFIMNRLRIVNIVIAVIVLLVLIGSRAFAVDKSGVKPNVLSLPTGPGSIEGLGESFEPELNTGTTHYQIKLAMPPGRAGFAPDLALSYNSGFGNGVFGMGWTLSVPHIQCQTDKGLPQYLTSGNAYIYSNGEELVPVSGGYYRGENEGDFIRFSRDMDTGGWMAQYKNGTVYKFGKTLDGRIMDSNGRVFKWLLEEAIDVHGNTIQYIHESKDDTVQKYLSHITYNTNMTVDFTYEPRTDVITDYKPTYELKTAFRCRLITLKAASQSVRFYRLIYKPETDVEKISLLASVSLWGKGGVASLPPAEFTYTEFTPTGLSVTSMDSAPNLPLSDASIDLLDINSDGLPDIVRTDNLYQTYYQNMGPDQNGVVQWSSEITMDASPKVLDLGNNAIQLADLDGDGKTDLMDLFGEDTQVYQLIKSGDLWAWQTGINITNRAFDFDDPKVRLCDLNNDKLIDVMRISSGVCSAWLNLGNGQWGDEKPTYFPNSNIDLGDSRYKLGDMNGDRLPDLVLLENERCHYYPNMGFGTFGNVMSYTRVPYGLRDYGKMFLSDVNGDGLSDAVYVDTYQAKAFLNLGLDPDDHSKAWFSDFIQVMAPDSSNSSSEFRMCDVNGNGSQDILWNTYPASYQVFTFIDFSPGEHAYQLKTVINGIGQTGTFHYGSSTNEMIRDRESGFPWTDTLPFPVTVMTAYDQSDGTTTYTTQYSYHNGYYDGLEKEFRGFERSELRQEGDASAESRVESYMFDTGKSHNARKGKPLAHSVQNGDGEVFFLETRNWQVRTLLGGLNDPRQVAYCYPDLMEKTVVEKGVGTPVTLREQYVVDNYGNITRKTESGRIDAGWDDERVTITTYSAGYPSGLNAWILDKVIESRVEKSDETKVSHTRNYYDLSTTLGEVTKGDLTRVSGWIKDDTFITTVQHRYDTYGNVQETRDGLYGAKPGHRSYYFYDSTYHTFLEEERFYKEVGTLSVYATWEAGLGVMKTSKDFNGNETVYGYDDFGRLTSVTKPGDDVFTQEYRYVLAHVTGQGKTINWVETLTKDDSPGDGYLVSRVYYDGLGRKLMTRSEGEEDGLVVVGDVVEFNAQKAPWKTYLPYAETGTLDYAPPVFNPAYATEHAYDGLGRETKTAFYGFAFSQTEYKPLEKVVYDEEQAKVGGDHDGCYKRFVEDGLGRLRQVIEAVKINDLGQSVDTVTEWPTSYTWNLLDQLTSYTDSLNNQKHFDYDGLGRKTFMNDPDQGQVSYEYDFQSNLFTTRDAKNQVIRYTYDGLNRLEKEYHGEFKTEPDVIYHYDTPVADVYRGEFWAASDVITARNALLTGNTLSSEYDANGDGVIDVADLVALSRVQKEENRVFSEHTLGRLSWVEDQSGEEIISYDERGRTAWTVKRIKDAEDQTNAFTTAMDYDSMDRVKRLYYPDSTHVSYQYNTRGLLDQIPGIIESMTYYPSGQVDTRTLTNGVTTHYSFDNRLRLVVLESTRTSDSRMFQDYYYGHDYVSNITLVEDYRTDEDFAAMAAELGSSQAETEKHSAAARYTYDSLYRLTQASAPDSFGTTTYRTDRIGNMVYKGHVYVGLGTMDYGGTAGKTGRDGRNPGDPPGPHALTWIQNDPDGYDTLTYDNNGNTTYERGMALSWDVTNRLTHVTGGTVSGAYTYDYMGQRKHKHVTDSNTGEEKEALYIDANSEIRDGKLIKYVVDGANRVARTVTDGSHTTLEPDLFYLHNHLGSTEAVLDTQGNLRGLYAYYPYGGVRLSLESADEDTPDYLFTGKERDDESSLDYFEARYYSSHYGRFNRVDPLLVQLTGDDERLKDVIFDPQKLNLYNYTQNSPITWSDETGLMRGARRFREFSRGNPYAQMRYSTVYRQIRELEPSFTVLRDPNRPNTWEDVRFLENHLTNLRYGERAETYNSNGYSAPFRFNSKTNRWHDPTGQFVRMPTAEQLREYARSQGWENTKTTPAGFETWTNTNGVTRMKIKPPSTQQGIGPGSRVSRVTIWNQSGQRVDGFGRGVTKKSPSAHAPIEW